MSGKTTRILFLGLGALLAVAILLQLWTGTNQPPDREPPNLALLIPQSLSGWTVRELPLAETEEAKNSAISMLQFDRYVSRSYTQGGLVITIYAAYWKPGKVPPRMVGVHTPDTCWIMNGWSCTQRERAVSLKLANGAPLKPAEAGTYTIVGNVQHVYFWHLVDGQPYSYVQEGAPSLSTIKAQLSDIRFGIRQKREQFFVRIASNQPWDPVWQNPGIQELFDALGRLALRAPTQP